MRKWTAKCARKVSHRNTTDSWNTGWPEKTSRTLRNYNGAYTLWGEISFGTFVDQYVLLLTYKFQWRHCDRVYAKGRKSDICPNRLYHHRNRCSKKMMVSAGVSWNGKTEFFSSALKRLQSTIRLTLTFWWRPCCHNAAVSIQTMISSPPHHDKANQNFLPDNTPDFISSQKWTPHSPDLNPLDYSVWDILQELVYEGRREPLRILKLFRMLSETNGTMSMTRKSEKLYCSGKGV